MLRLSVLAVLAALVGGCAFNPQATNLAPRATVAASNVGRNVAVGVRVLDERPSKSLGRRGSGLYGAAAEITSAQDLAVVVDGQVKDALRKKGFRPIDYSSTGDVGLAVEIRLLEYSTSVGFWTGGINVKGGLKAVANRGSESYERLYRVDREERVVIVPTAEANEAMINAALDELLSQLFEDNGLYLFLASPAGGTPAAAPAASGPSPQWSFVHYG